MLATERLRFEAWRRDDLPLLYDLHVDPRVQPSYAEAPGKWTMEGIERRLNGYLDEQDKFGFTKWKLVLQDGTFIGRAGWSPFDEGSIEIGYAIKPQYWGQGYASEAANALVTWAREMRPDCKLVGFALPGNDASRRVLIKMGMVFVDRREISGTKYSFYELRDRY